MEIHLLAEFHLMPFSYFSAHFPELVLLFPEGSYSSFAADPINRVLLTNVPIWGRYTIEVYQGNSGYIYAQDMLRKETGVPFICNYVLTDEMQNVLSFVNINSAMFTRRSDIRILGDNMASFEFMIS